MIFTTKAFLVFLPIVLFGYHWQRGRTAKYRWLLAASWLFYAWVPPHYWLVLLALTLIDYIAALKIDHATAPAHRRAWLLASILANLGLLFAFKYTPFLMQATQDGFQLLGQPASWSIPDWVLPLGLSFHTFQGISYTVDVYRRQIRAVDSFVDYALFVSFFPQLAAGPIVRAVEFLPQMETPPRVRAEQVTEGLVLVARGLVKKLLIADTLDQCLVSPVFADPAGQPLGWHNWATIGWAVQIYCDFSGYTDLARGIAKWFGFELPENFRYPFLATSITDFWRRWHLSLSTWLRDYLYFPLGGSQRGPLRTYLNLMLLFVLCGLWHGATWAWLVYGLYNGFWMALHRAWDHWAKQQPGGSAWRQSLGWVLLGWVAHFFVFLVGLILIRMESWSGGGQFIQSLTNPSAWAAMIPAGTADSPPVLALGLIALGLVGHAGPLLTQVVPLIGRPWPEPLRLAVAIAGLLLVLIFSAGTSKTFIYIQF